MVYDVVEFLVVSEENSHEEVLEVDARNQKSRMKSGKKKEEVPGRTKIMRAEDEAAATCKLQTRTKKYLTRRYYLLHTSNTIGSL